MRVVVNAHKIDIPELKENFNKGEYNVQECVFDFSEEYTDDYVKVALFTNSTGTYKKIIVNNKCKVPPEVLNTSENVLLGVYAYLIINEEIQKRYSPVPRKFPIIDGSYNPNAINSEEITPSELEQYQQALNNYINEANAKLEEINDTLDETEEELAKVIVIGDAVQAQGKEAQEIANQVKEDYEAGNFTPEILVGETTTLEPESEATVSNTGTKLNPIFNFGIPQGKRGDCYFATFSIVEGHLIMNKPENLSQINFRLNDKGHLMAEVGI